MSFLCPQQGLHRDELHSSNGEFMIRELPQDEAKTLFSILLPYYEYLKTNPKSLLTRYLLLFRTSKDFSKKYYVVERIPTLFDFYKKASNYVLLNVFIFVFLLILGNFEK